MRLRTILLVFFSLLVILMDASVVVLARRQIHQELIQEVKDQMSIPYAAEFHRQLFQELKLLRHHFEIIPELAGCRVPFMGRRGPLEQLEDNHKYSDILDELFHARRPGTEPPVWARSGFDPDATGVKDEDLAFYKLYSSLQGLYNDIAPDLINDSENNLDLLILADRQGRPYACVTSDPNGKLAHGAGLKMPKIRPGFQKLIDDCIQGSEDMERGLLHSDGRLYMVNGYMFDRTYDVLLMGNRVDADFASKLSLRSGGLQCAVVYPPLDKKAPSLNDGILIDRSMDKSLSENLAGWLTKQDSDWGEEIRQERVGGQEYLVSRQPLTHGTAKQGSDESYVYFFKPLAGAEERAASITGGIVVIGILVCIVGLLGTLWIASRVASGIEHLSTSFLKVGQGDLGVNLEPSGSLEVRQAATAFNQMVQQLRQRSMLARMVPRTALEAIEKESSAAGGSRVHGQRIRCTVLFSDIRGFTTLSERLEPDDVVALLDVYMGRMTAVIEAAGGDVIDYIGDAILADFQDREGKSGAVQAVLAAHGMNQELLKMSQENVHPEMAKLRQGIGLHLGDVVKGSIGSEDRSKYTIIGDTVNVAARIEDRSKDGRHSCILVSEECRTEIMARRSSDGPESQFQFEAFGEETLKGKSQPIVIWELRA